MREVANDCRTTLEWTGVERPHCDGFTALLTHMRADPILRIGGGLGDDEYFCPSLKPLTYPVRTSF
jgi:hypothetical protein